MKKYIILSLCFMALVICSCVNNGDPLASDITLNKATTEICVNGTNQLVATVTPSGSIGVVKWTSSDPAIATVVNGLVTGVATGSATITASLGSGTATCTVTVSAAITSLTMNKTSSTMLVGGTLALTATPSPMPSAAVLSSLTWVSTNPTVATVDNSGKVVALTTGSTTIVASLGNQTAVCPITVLKSIPTSLSGTNYYLISIDAASVNIVNAVSNVVADFRPDNSTKNLYLWNGFSAGTCSGNNFYGNAATWPSFVVSNGAGWSGGAFNVAAGATLNTMKAISDDTSGKYYLHFAIKSSTTNSYEFRLEAGSTNKIIVFGTSAMDGTNPFSGTFILDGTTTTTTAGNFARDGKWHEIEIPMTYFKNLGLTYTTGMTATNVFDFLAGAISGVKVELDAIFIYKKP